MSWSTDASGRKTWVPWIVGEPTSGQVPAWNTTRSRWEPTTISTTSPGRLTALASTQGLWLFDGNLNDSSGNARNLTVASGSAPQYIMRPGVGTFGQIVAASRYKETATDWSLVKDNVTVEVVLRGNQQAAFTHVLLGKTGTIDQNWWFRSSTNGVLEFNFYDTSNNVRISTAGQRLPPWKLTHIAATQEISGGNTTVNLYLNGANVLTNVFTGKVPRTIASQQLVIGGQFGGNDYWSATGAAEYHGIAIHSTVLDATTIAARALAVLGAG